MVTMEDVIDDMAIRAVRRAHRHLRQRRHVRRSAADRLRPIRDALHSLARRTSALEPGISSRGSTATSGRSSSAPISSPISATSSGSRTIRTTSRLAGTFDPYKLGVPPQIYWPGVRKCEARCMQRHHDGELFVETLAPMYMVLQKQNRERAEGKRARRFPRPAC